MKSKNPGLASRLGTVEAALGVDAAQEGKPKRRERLPDDVPLSIRLPKVMHEELRRLAFDERTSIHGMILDGISMYLKSKGIETE